MQYLTAVHSEADSGMQYINLAYEEFCQAVRRIHPTDICKSLGAAIDKALALCRDNSDVGEAEAAVKTFMRIFDTAGCAKIIGAATEAMTVRFRLLKW